VIEIRAEANGFAVFFGNPHHLAQFGMQRRLRPIDQTDAVNDAFPVRFLKNGFQSLRGHRRLHDAVFSPARGTTGAFQIANAQKINVQNIRLPKKFHDGTQLDREPL
jgi:hypothetical protein